MIRSEISKRGFIHPIGEKNRAVVFLDPYGAQVDWSTIRDIGETKTIDLWVLFPLGQAVNRMSTRHEPNPAWTKRLWQLVFSTAGMF